MKSNINHGGLKLGVRYFLIFLFLFVSFLQNTNAVPQWQTKSFKKGDALRLIIWQPWRIGDGKNQMLDINGDYPIDSRGYVFFPLIGDVKVVGYNSITLAEELKEKFSPYFQDPVIITNPLIRVTMLGSFRRPGTYLAAPEAGLWELVDRAGPEDESNLKKMVIERAGKTVKKNLLSGFEKGYSLQEMGIYSGDQIFVPRKKEFRVRDALEILRFAMTLANIYFIVVKIKD